MKRILPFIALAAVSVLSMFSCKPEPAEIRVASVTGEATHISCRNAKLSGKVTRSQTKATNLSFGVLYSTSSGVLLGSATQLEAKEFDADYNFTVDSGVLEPETTYYYRSYIIQNDKVEYGDTKSFKTLALSSMIQTLDASGVNHKDATLNAMLDLTDCNYSSIEYGFDLTPEGGQAKTLTANNLADKAFSYRDENLVMNTGYSYVAYVRLDDILYKGETKTFTTTSILASATDLSSSASANCYIISDAGFTSSRLLRVTAPHQSAVLLPLRSFGRHLAQIRLLNRQTSSVKSAARKVTSLSRLPTLSRRVMLSSPPRMHPATSSGHGIYGLPTSHSRMSIITTPAP
ncbi:MAG: hypothetical protein SO114_04145 [Candidatus Cryptobacteroides sp.]|nr:hypothetical protein [Candidatus Cryptobacteroides sp.]